MKDSRTWIARKVSWRRWNEHTIDGVKYIAMDIFEDLFNERLRLMKKLSRERIRRKKVEANNARVDGKYVWVRQLRKKANEEK